MRKVYFYNREAVLPVMRALNKIGSSLIYKLMDMHSLDPDVKTMFYMFDMLDIPFQFKAKKFISNRGREYGIESANSLDGDFLKIKSFKRNGMYAIAISTKMSDSDLDDFLIRLILQYGEVSND